MSLLPGKLSCITAGAQMPHRTLAGNSAHRHVPASQAIVKEWMEDCFLLPSGNDLFIGKRDLDFFKVFGLFCKFSFILFIFGCTGSSLPHAFLTTGPPGKSKRDLVLQSNYILEKR